MEANAVERALEAVKGHERPEPLYVTERYAAWAGGRGDESMAFMVAGCKHQASDRIAEVLFDLHVMEFHAPGFCVKARKAKEWAYTTAANFVNTRRHQGRIRDYRLSWGRQAARDGLCLALWGHLRGTGLQARSLQFSIGERSYQRVRDAVRDNASSLILEFETLLGAANALDWRDELMA